jgi:hypothetical protein
MGTISIERSSYARVARFISRVGGFWFVAYGLLFGLRSANAMGPMWGFFLAFLLVAACIIMSSYEAAYMEPSGRTVIGFIVCGLIGSIVAWLPVVPAQISPLLGGLFLLVSATALGGWLGKGISSASHLWPLVIVVLGVDTWSVFSPEGLTHQILEGEGTLPAYYLLMATPMPGSELIAEPLIGLGDLLMTGLLVGAVVKLGLSLSRVMVGISLGYLSCLGALFLLEEPLPALPFIGVLAVLMLGREARPRLKEMAYAVVFTGIIILLYGMI